MTSSDLKCQKNRVICLGQNTKNKIQQYDLPHRFNSKLSGNHLENSHARTNRMQNSVTYNDSASLEDDDEIYANCQSPPRNKLSNMSFVVIISKSISKNASKTFIHAKFACTTKLPIMEDGSPHSIIKHHKCGRQTGRHSTCGQLKSQWKYRNYKWRNLKNIQEFWPDPSDKQYQKSALFTLFESVVYQEINAMQNGQMLCVIRQNNVTLFPKYLIYFLFQQDHFRFRTHPVNSSYSEKVHLTKTYLSNRAYSTSVEC
ncbi:hypothetical protein EGR_10522 [Echinococcus granulosus]|uniref:Uncharacterized protein n=1 Tax=Echinococcus granulosus TaxID=6210 RepID=W6U0H7_ECHGR|nr:hypothetical protein EGR_10522 [Echinococcus granulosus]EUB54615.1 hypothetical protein EGR_10522 [Echinococcus granulosus]